MYAIYEMIYGVRVPKKLNREFQENEVTEAFWAYEENLKSHGHEDFDIDVPYSGDDIADCHIGFAYDSTENEGAPVTLSAEDKKEYDRRYEEEIKPLLIEAIKKDIDDMDELSKKEEYDYADQLASLKKFLSLIEKSKLEEYRAYSTS